MLNQLTSGAIQYGVPMVVLLLPSVFSTTAEIPGEEEEKGVRREGGSKGRDERRGEMEEVEEKKGGGKKQTDGQERENDCRGEKVRGGRRKVRGARRKREKEGKRKKKFHTHTIGQETFADIYNIFAILIVYLQFDLYRENSVCETTIASLRILTSQPRWLASAKI